MKTLRLILLFAGLLLSVTLLAQVKPESKPKVKAEDKDWAQFDRYAAQNAAQQSAPLAVLYGDSITDNWAKLDGQWLTDHRFLGRGISGQTTSQMLVRFRQDVIERNPQYVVILAGINDIARNTGRISTVNTFKNIVSMAELAKYNNIKPVLCTVLPADTINWRPSVADPRPKIDTLNTFLREYSAANDIPFVDYYSALTPDQGALNEAYASDPVHPNLEGYKVMEAVLLELFDRLGVATEPKE